MNTISEQMIQALKRLPESDQISLLHLAQAWARIQERIPAAFPKAR